MRFCLYMNLFLWLQKYNITKKDLETPSRPFMLKVRVELQDFVFGVLFVNLVDLNFKIMLF